MPLFERTRCKMSSDIISLYLFHKLYGLDGKHVEIMLIEFDAKYHRLNNSISDPNDHHPLVNVNVDRFLYMLRTIHYRRNWNEVGPGTLTNNKRK